MTKNKYLLITITLVYALNFSFVNAETQEPKVEVGTIKKAFENTIEYNHQFSISRNKALALLEDYNKVYKDLLPQVSLGVSVHPWSTVINDGNSKDGQTYVTERLTIKQPLFSWFTTVSDLVVAEYQVELALAKFDNEQQNILLQVARSYNGVIANRINLRLQKRRLLQSKSRVESARTSYRVGSLSQTSLARAEAELSRATVQVIQIKRQLEESENLFKDLTGSTVSKNAKLPNFRKLIVDKGEEDFIQKVLKKNNLLKAVEYGNKIAHYRYIQSLSTPLPIKIDLLLSGTWGQKWGDKIAGFMLNDQRYAVEIQGFLQLYQGGYSGSIRRRLHAVSDRLESEYKVTKQNVIRSAKQIYRRKKDHIILLSASLGAVKAQNTAKEGFVAGEKLGLYSKIDVIEAEKQFLATKLEHTNTQLNIVNTEMEALSLLGLFTPSLFDIKTKFEDPRQTFKSSRWNLSYFE